MSDEGSPARSLWDQLADKNRRFAQLVKSGSPGQSASADCSSQEVDVLSPLTIAPAVPADDDWVLREDDGSTMFASVRGENVDKLDALMKGNGSQSQPLIGRMTGHSSRSLSDVEDDDDDLDDPSALLEDVETVYATTSSTSNTSPSSSTEREVLVVETPQLTFSIEDPEKEVKESLKLRNCSSSVLVFKIKTTNPYLFDAHPAIGFLYPGEALAATATLHEGVNVSHEKFLVAAATMPDYIHVEYLRSSALCDLWKCIDERHVVTERVPCIVTGKYRQRSHHLTAAFARQPQKPVLTQCPTSNQQTTADVSSCRSDVCDPAVAGLQTKKSDSEACAYDVITTRAAADAVVERALQRVSEGSSVSTHGMQSDHFGQPISEIMANFNDNANLRGWLHKDLDYEVGGNNILTKYFSRMRLLQTEAKGMIKRLDVIDEKVDAVVPQLRRIERAGVEVASEMGQLQQQLEVLSRQAKRCRAVAAATSDSDEIAAGQSAAPAASAALVAERELLSTGASVVQLRREFTGHVESFHAAIESLMRKHADILTQVHRQEEDIENLFGGLRPAESSTFASDENFSSNAPARRQQQKRRPLRHEPGDSGDSGDFTTEDEEADSESDSKLDELETGSRPETALEPQLRLAEGEASTAVTTQRSPEAATAPATPAPPAAGSPEKSRVVTTRAEGGRNKVASVRLARLERNQHSIGEQLAGVNADLNVLSQKAAIMTDILRNIVSEMRHQKKELAEEINQWSVQIRRADKETRNQGTALQYSNHAENLNTVLAQKLDRIMDMAEKLSVKHRSMTDVVNNQARGVQKLKRIVKLLEKGIADEHEHILREHAKNKAMLAGLAGQHDALQQHAKKIHSALFDLVSKSKIIARKVTRIRGDLLGHKRAVSRDMHTIREEVFGPASGDATGILRDKLANIAVEVKLMEDAATGTSAAIQELAGSLRQHRDETSGDLDRMRHEAAAANDRLTHEANKLFAAAGREMAELQEQVRALDQRARAADDGIRVLREDVDQTRRRVDADVSGLAAETRREVSDRIKELLGQQATMRSHVEDALGRAKSLQDHHGYMRDRLDALHADLAGNVDSVEARLRESAFQMSNDTQQREQKTEAFRQRAADELHELGVRGDELRDDASRLQTQLDDVCGHIREETEKLNAEVARLAEDAKREYQALLHSTEEQMARHETDLDERLTKMEDQLKADCESWMAQLHKRQLTGINDAIKSCIAEVDAVSGAMDSLARQADRSFYALVLLTVVLAMLVYAACLDGSYVSSHASLGSSLWSYLARNILKNAVSNRQQTTSWSQWLGLGRAGWRMDQM